MADLPVDENVDVLIPALSRALGGRDGVMEFLKEIRPAIQSSTGSWTNYLLECLEDSVIDNEEELTQLAKETRPLERDEPLYKWDAELGDFVEVQRDQKV